MVSAVAAQKTLPAEYTEVFELKEPLGIGLDNGHIKIYQVRVI